MKTCTVDGCDKKHMARGLCGTHYNQQHQPNRHRKLQVACTVCGVTVVKHPSKRYRPVCSNECRTILEFGRPKQGRRRKSQALVGPVPKPPRSQEAPMVEVGPSRGGLVAGSCRWCGKAFVQDLRPEGRIGRSTSAARYCSSQCSRIMHKRNRKARRLKAGGVYTLAEVVRVWLKFDKRCAYCNEPTDGLPEPDHVVPLARGGSNSITNILPSCRACNCDKNATPLHLWNADRTRRGLPPRITAWPVGDPRITHLTSITFEQAAA